MQTSLRDNYGLASPVFLSKTVSMAAAPDAWYEEIGRTCNVAVVGSADCGACSAWSCHDSVELAKRGVYSVLVTSNVFVQSVRLQAASLGYPGLPLIEIEHPFGTRSIGDVQHLAQAGAVALHSMLYGD